MNDVVTGWIWVSLVCLLLTLFTNYIRQLGGSKKDIFNINCLIELFVALIPIINIIFGIVQFCDICMIYIWIHFRGRISSEI